MLDILTVSSTIILSALSRLRPGLGDVGYLLRVLESIVKATKDLQVLDIVATAFPPRNYMVHLQLVARTAKVSVGMTMTTGFVALKDKAASGAADSSALTRFNFYRLCK